MKNTDMNGEAKTVAYRDVKYDPTVQQYTFEIAKRARLLSVHIDRKFHMYPVFRFSFLVNVGAAKTTKYFNVYQPLEQFPNITIMDHICSVENYHIFQTHKEQK